MECFFFEKLAYTETQQRWHKKFLYKLTYKYKYKTLKTLVNLI